MARWLVKEEPKHYSFSDLIREGQTAWTGVRNPLAQRYLRAMRKGDLVLYYHTGSERAVVGVARVLTDPKAEADGPPGAVQVELGPVRRLPRPVGLAEIRAEPDCASMPLVRIGRLSVMPVTRVEWMRIEAKARGPAP